MEITEIYISRVLDAESGFGARTDTGEQVFIPPSVTRAIDAEEGDIVTAKLIPNTHPNSTATPWVAVHASLVGDEDDADDGYRALYEQAKVEAERARANAAKLYANLTAAINRLSRLSRWMDITDEELALCPIEEMPEDHRYVEAEVNAALAELKGIYDGN